LNPHDKAFAMLRARTFANSIVRELEICSSFIGSSGRGWLRRRRF